jgi:hypothetical protein
LAALGDVAIVAAENGTELDGPARLKVPTMSMLRLY